ncbi:MAG: HK97-gp10 family putative phage morphogenesis protein [Planctomycetota bacterium]
MADIIRIEVLGLRELGQAFARLSDDMQKKAARAATNAAAQVVKKRAVLNIITSPSVETGALKRSVIVKKLPPSQTPLTSEHIVTVRGRGKKLKSGKTQDSAPYAHFLEFGSVKMPAEPFLRPALDAGKQEAIQAMKDKLADRIAAAVKT